MVFLVSYLLICFVVSSLVMRHSEGYPVSEVEMGSKKNNIVGRNTDNDKQVHDTTPSIHLNGTEQAKKRNHQSNDDTSNQKHNRNIASEESKHNAPGGGKDRHVVITTRNGEQRVYAKERRSRHLHSRDHVTNDTKQHVARSRNHGKSASTVEKSKDSDRIRCGYIFCDRKTQWCDEVAEECGSCRLCKHATKTYRFLAFCKMHCQGEVYS